MKRTLLIIFICLLAFSSCGQNNGDEELENESVNASKNVLVDGDQVFDKEMLSKYNGQNRMKAYVAVDGIVYDVSDVKAWKGLHQGKYEPGYDYSEIIRQSPHGLKNLEGLPIVGTYLETTESVEELEVMTEESSDIVVEVEENELPVFNKDTLADFDGTEGKFAYVAVDGIVYDVSDVPLWKGKHRGKYIAGKDYSEIIRLSPHGLKNLEGLPIVGSYE